MLQSKQSALLLEIARRLRSKGSWAGETHVQKNAYLLQEMLRVPAGFRFVLYRHGPFSFDLREQLFEMEAARVVQFHEQPYPYGPKIVDGVSAPLFNPAVLLPDDERAKIAFLAEKLGKSGVADLERIATAFYVSHDEGTTSSEWQARLRELKPHIDEAGARIAFERLGELKRDARCAGFVASAPAL